MLSSCRGVGDESRRDGAAKVNLKGGGGTTMGTGGNSTYIA